MHSRDRQNEAVLATAQAAALDSLAVAVAAALTDSGIDNLLLRGPVLARRLYDSPAERAYSDVDLLVSPEDFAAAEAVLAELGLREAALEAAFPEARPGHAHTWAASDGRAVDLHRTLVGAGASAAVVWRLLRDGAASFALEGANVLVPPDSALALAVTLHAAHHVDRSPQPLDDLERALERLPAIVWTEAAELANRIEARQAFAAGLRMTEKGRSTLARVAPELAALSAPADVSGERSFHVAQGLVWLHDMRGARAKASFLRERMLPSTRAMHRRSGLARRGRVGLLLAYLLRWLDALRALPPAMWGLRRARRRPPGGSAQ